jgi:hypothetical protein
VFSLISFNEVLRNKYNKCVLLIVIGLSISDFVIHLKEESRMRIPEKKKTPNREEVTEEWEKL